MSPKDLRTAKANDQPAVEMSLEELLEELGKDIPEIIHPDEITVKMATDHYKMTPRNADLFLASKVKEGVLVMNWRRDENGHRIKAYSKAVGGEA